jgi:ABC-2 type transport system permease protein
VIGGLGGFFFLLVHELRLTFRTRADSQRWGRLVVLGVLALLLLAVGWSFALLLQTMEPSLSPPSLAVASAALLFLATLMLGHALIAATEAVYTRGDLDLLLSSPFSPWTVLTVRALGVAVRVATVYLALSSGLLISLALIGAWRWLGIGGALVGLTLFTTAIGVVLTMALFATIGPRATRVASQVLGALIGASLVLALQLPNMGRRGDRAESFQRLLDWIRQLDWPANHPLYLPARAFMGDPEATMLWIGGSALLFFLAALWFSSRFEADAAAVQSLGPRRRADLSRARPFRGGVTVSLVLKEWRLLRRDPLLLSQILLQMIWMAPLVVLWSRTASDGQMSNSFLGLIGGAVTAIAASLAASLTWITVSAEDSPDLIAAAPVERATVERGKLVAATVPILFIVAGAALLIAQESAPAALWTFAGAASGAVSAAFIGLWHQEPGSRRDFRRRPRASWTAQLGQAFVGIGWAGATGFAAAGLPLLALIPGIIALGLLLALGDSRRAATTG